MNNLIRIKDLGLSKERIKNSLSNSKMLLIAAPSGTGKGSVIKDLLSRYSREFYLAVSVTTRKPRPGEVDGLNYFFVSADEFEQMIKDGEFTESALYNSNFYGTLKSEVIKANLSEKIVVTEIEMQGVEETTLHFPGKAKGVLLYPPTEAELMRRLIGRKTENDRQISARLGIALDEMLRGLVLGLHPICSHSQQIERAADEVALYARKAFK